MVIGWRHLDDIGRDQVHALHSTQYADHFAAGDTGNFGRTGARSVRRIENVDIDRQV